MTSTFPTSRSSSQTLKNGIKEIQSKKESLTALEIALKKRINELRELCLKEGELTGQLPVDYPLQPREPIPQVRRRITRSHGNIPISSMANTMALSDITKSRQHEHPARFAIPPLNPINLPSRPTSTNSTNSSASTTSSNTIKSVKVNELTNYQPYYEEEVKPFQLSDFYKYSSKHRQHYHRHNHHFKTPSEPLAETISNIVHNKSKTTRQLQEEVALGKNSIKFASCDDQYQASRRLIEKSGQKLIQATARAIAVNPGLAEKLDNILPHHTERY